MSQRELVLHRTSWGTVRQSGPFICINDLLAWSEWWQPGECRDHEVALSRQLAVEHAGQTPKGGCAPGEALRFDVHELWCHAAWIFELVSWSEEESSEGFEWFQKEASELVDHIQGDLFPGELLADSSRSVRLLQEKDDDKESDWTELDDEDSADECWLPELQNWR